MASFTPRRSARLASKNGTVTPATPAVVTKRPLYSSTAQAFLLSRQESRNLFLQYLKSDVSSDLSKDIAILNNYLVDVEITESKTAKVVLVSTLFRHLVQHPCLMAQKPQFLNVVKNKITEFKGQVHTVSNETIRASFQEAIDDLSYTIGYDA